MTSLSFSLVDFSKAFDTLNFSTFLNNLPSFNFSTPAINLLQSYLTNRRQFIQYSSKRSKLASVVSSVPQGSLLGPIFFNLYVTSMNLKTTATNASVINYVDGFQILHHHSPVNLPNIVQKTKISVETLKNEANNLDLSLNYAKTKFLLISTKQLSKKYNLTSVLPEINIDNNKISRTICQKNLGIHFDQHLNFNTHHSKTISSAFATLRSLNSLKHSLSTKIKLQLIDSLIFNKLTYGNVVTFPINKTWSTKYNKMFKVALSFAYNKYITSKDLPSIEVLNIISRWKLSLLTLTYKCLYFPHLPTYLKLSPQSNPHHKLRFSSAPLFNVPTTKDDTFADNASTLFNSLPSSIRSIQGEKEFHCFKINVTSYLLANQQPHQYQYHPLKSFAFLCLAFLLIDSHFCDSFCKCIFVFVFISDSCNVPPLGFVIRLCIIQ